MCKELVEKYYTDGPKPQKNIVFGQIHMKSEQKPANLTTPSTDPQKPTQTTIIL